MKSDIYDYVWLLLPVLVLFMCAIIFWSSEHVDVGWKKKAAQTECAQFHPKTGKFEWIEQ